MEPKDVAPADLEKIKNYLADKPILVLDSSNGSRFSVTKVLAELGAPIKNIQSIKGYKLAEQDVKERGPNIIICEYEVDGMFSLDLQRLQKEIHSNSADRLFMLITANSSESVVAEAAEEDVDSFLLKPFSNSDLFEYLVKTFLAKISPSPYTLKIEEGKELLKLDEYKDALGSFNEAKPMIEKPCLAYYYAAQVIEESDNDFNAALKEYEDGLKLMPWHYKCLIGQFESYDSLKKMDKAYEVIQKIAAKFPISPQRLAKVFKLAVYTKNFRDINKYYELYQKLNRKSEELNKVVPAGLLVYGKYMLNLKNWAQAEDALHKAVLASQLDHQYIEKVMELLLEHDLNSAAEVILSLFPQADRETDLFKYLNFRVLSLTAPDDKVINEGRALVKDSIKHHEVYEIVIQRLKKIGKQNTAETVVYKAAEVFPKRRAYFVAMLDEE